MAVKHCPDFRRSTPTPSKRYYKYKRMIVFGIRGLNTEWANGEIGACFGGVNSPLPRAFACLIFFTAPPYLQ